MIDSTNPRSMADNIRKLWDKFSKIAGDLLPSRSTATTGQILKLTGENKTPVWADEYSYTPPAYSETEVNTGQKWIDGKDIYCRIITGQFPTIESSYNLSIDNLDFDTLIVFEELLYDNNVYTTNRNVRNYSKTNKRIGVYSIGTIFSEYYYAYTLYYTKPDPVPGDAKGPEDSEQEPEEKKTTRKKTK